MMNNNNIISNTNSNSNTNSSPRISLRSVLKNSNIPKLDSLKEENGNNNNNHNDDDNEDDDDEEEEEEDDDDDDDDDANVNNINNTNNDNNGSDSDNDIEMEVFTLEEIIQKMPLTFLAYEFYFENQYWYYANLWHTILGYLSILRIVILILETCNGPNYYDGRENRADYQFLPTKSQYWTFEIVCMVPLCVDTFFLIITLLCIGFRKKLSLLLDNIRSNYFELFVIVIDIISLIPFIVNAIAPGVKLVWTTVFRLLTLFVFGHLLRCSKVSPIFFTVRVALVRAGPRLLLPVFFFFCLNIVISVILYYIEPCYNVDLCHNQWKDLLDASFYALVTMCTVGYGNQTAQYITGRFLAVLLMIFGGAVFISLPLVIIGGEYDEAIALVDTFRKGNDAQRKKHAKWRLQAFKLLGLSGLCKGSVNQNDVNDNNLKKVTPLPQQSMRSSSKMRITKLLSGTVHRFDHSNSAIFKCSQNIRNILKLANKESQTCNHLSPLLLICLSDLRGWIAVLISHMDIAMEILDIEIDSKSNDSGRVLQNLVKDRITSSEENVLNEIFEKHEDALSYIHKQFIRPILVSFGLSNYLDSSLNNSMSSDNTPNEKKNNSDESDDDSDSGHSDDSAERITKQNTSHLDVLAFSVHSKGSMNNETLTRRKHLAKILNASMNSDSIKNRLWLLIEVPESSWQARSFQYLVMICIILSIVVLYTQSVTTYVDYGESTNICQKTVQLYCQDKEDQVLNPGCYVYNDDSGPTDVKLEFNCDGKYCFGYGSNFGSKDTNMTCSNQFSRPFEEKSPLDLFYGPITFLTTRKQINLQSDICKRVECVENTGIENINLMWFLSECALTTVFTFECLARFFVSESYSEYFLSYQNVLDVVSVCPFFVELFISAITNNKLVANYSILASYIDNTVLGLRSVKVIRLFKFGRHFLSTQVLIETVYKVFSQLLGAIFLLGSFSWLFSSILFELEKGRECYVGESNCDPGNGQIVGQRTFINIKGSPSSYSNFWYSLWFSFVTLTSTGYGDIVPVTLAGQLVTITGMFLGQCWMTIPMTATGSTYYKLFNKFFNKLKKLEKLEKNKEDEEGAFQPREQARLVLFYKQLRTSEAKLARVMKYLKRPYNDESDDDDDDDDSTRSFILREFDSTLSYITKLFGSDDSMQAQDLTRLGEECMMMHIKLYDDIRAGK